MDLDYEIVHHPACRRELRGLDRCPCGATQRAVWRYHSRPTGWDDEVA